MTSLEREARARQSLALIWAVVVALGTIGLVWATRDTVTGRLLGVAAVLGVVGVLDALLVALLNRGLAREPDRSGRSGPASLTVVTLVVTWLIGVVLAVVISRPLGLLHLAVLMIVTGGYLALGLVAVATTRAAAARRPLPSVG